MLLAGSFGKVLFPALRLGYLVLPAALVERVAALQSATVRHPPVLEQAVLAAFIEEGHLSRHVRRMREVYAERRAALYEAAERLLGERLVLSPVEAGLQTTGLLAPGARAVAVVRGAAEQDVEVTALGREWRGRFRREGLQLGFAAVPPEEIRRGVEVLARVIDSSQGLRLPRSKFFSALDSGGEKAVEAGRSEVCSEDVSTPAEDPNLIAAATALQATLERLREVVERSLHGSLTTRKQIERTAAALTALGPVETGIGLHARALVGAIDRSRRLQEALTHRAHARALELQARSGELQFLMDALGTLGQEAHRVAGSFEGQTSPESLAAAAVELDALVARARELGEQAGARGFEDVRREVESLRQQLSAARNRLTLSGGPARA